MTKYTTHGLLLSGNSCNQRLWKKIPLLQQSPKRFKYIDLTQPINYSGMLHLIDLYTKKNQPTGLIGFSMGGYLALEYLLQSQQHISYLILISCTATGYTLEKKKARKNLILTTDETHSSWRSELNLSHSRTGLP